MVELSGLVCALTTPFRDDQSLDLDAYRRLMDVVIDDGIEAIVVAGCTGEPWALGDEERWAMFETAVDQVRNRVPVVAGCGAMVPAASITHARRARDAGCDAIMVHPPYYTMPSLAEVYDFYKQILAASDLPMMIYNIPSRTGVHMTPDLVDRLADEPGVIALKESSKDWLVLSEMIRRAKDRLNVLVGYADTLGLAGMTEGAVGVVEALLPPLVGPAYRRFVDAGVAGEREEAVPLQAEFARRQAELRIGSFPAPLKAALNMMGRPGGRPRDPIQPLDATRTERVREVLLSMGLVAAEPARRAG